MKIVALLSGGLDSSTLVRMLIEDGHEVEAMAVDYGQRHQRELNSAADVANHYGIRLGIVPMDFLAHLLPGSSQTDRTVAVPHGRYDEESMKATVVPNRNMILLALAAARASAIGASAIAYAAHAGDHAIYPDCRPEFVAAMKAALLLCDWKQIELLVPMVDWTKGRIVQYALEHGVPLHLTWTCYEGGVRPCRKCGACVERAEAFAFANAQDPLEAHS